MDDIRPRGTVQVECSHPGCGWSFWLDPLDERLPNGPHYCQEHETDPVRKAAWDSNLKAE